MANKQEATSASIFDTSREAESPAIRKLVGVIDPRTPASESFTEGTQGDEQNSFRDIQYMRLWNSKTKKTYFFDTVTKVRNHRN